MQDFRMAYAFLDKNDFSNWIRGLWEGTFPRKDLLRAHLATRLGEVRGWGGKDPHVSISDCQMCSDPQSFERIVKSIIELVEPPTIIPQRLCIHRGSHLVVDIRSQILETVATAIRAATSSLISRSEITDEEWQMAELQASQTKNQEDLQVLKMARENYEKSGCPPLDSGRYFRLGMLISLTKRKINMVPDAATASKNLQHFLVTGEPPWYGKPTVLHTTIASGLNPEVDTIEKYGPLWDEIKCRFGEIKIDNLSIMGTDTNDSIKIKFWDSVTQTFVEEERPKFKVIRNINFGSSS